MKKVEAKPENLELAKRAAHCKVALDCYTPKMQRAALEAIARMKGEKPSEADVKAVCSALADNGLKVLDVLINSLLDSLAGLTLEDRVLVTEALIALQPEEERKFAEQAETDRLLDKILNDILAKLSNAQLETILKEVTAVDNYVTAFVLAAANPEMASNVHSELLDQESPDETDLPDFAPITACYGSIRIVHRSINLSSCPIIPVQPGRLFLRRS